MAIKFRKILRGLAFAGVLALSLTASTGGSQAQIATAEQRAACSPDAFRLCAGQIPNVSAITACMRRNYSNLSPACQSVFPK